MARCMEIRQQLDVPTAQKTQMTAKRGKIMTYLQTRESAARMEAFINGSQTR